MVGGIHMAAHFQILGPSRVNSESMAGQGVTKCN